MKVKAYLAYYDINSDDFNDMNDYYKTSDDYVQAVNSMNKSSSTIVYKAPSGQEYRFHDNVRQNEEKVAYAQCDAILYNKEGKDETVDEFITECVSKNVQLYTLRFDLDNCEPDFEQELNLWFSEHHNLQRYAKEKEDDWILNNEPKRNIKIEFINKANEKKYAEFVNCKIMEKQNLNIYIVLVEQVNLIDKFN